MQKVDSGSIDKIITIPASKSYANRLLILGSLVSENLEIINLPKCQDVIDMVSGLKQIGISIENGTVKGIFPPGDSKDVINSGEGGTTNRFLMALLLLDSEKYQIKPSASFLKRPLDSYIRCLRELGAKISIVGDVVSLQGPINYNENPPFEELESSQFMTALKLAFYNKDLDFGRDYKYLIMTDELIRRVRSGERRFELPADFSSMSYPLALAAVNGKVTITNGFPSDTFQADSYFIDIIRKIGAHVDINKNELSVLAANSLASFTADAKKTPDLIPTLAFLASRCDGVSKLENLSILKEKESDRFKEIENLLKLFEVEYRIEKDTLLISGDRKCVEYKEYDCPQDHRMAMTAFLFMKSNSGGIINNHECVNKSFPEFFELLS